MQDANGFSALMRAAEKGHAAVAAELLRVSACKPDLCSGRQETALSLAAAGGSTELVKRLLRAHQPDKLHAALFQKDIKGQTPLHKAACAGHVHVVDLLLNDFPAALRCTYLEGSTALHAASSRGHAAVVASILKARGQGPAASCSGSEVMTLMLCVCI